MTRTLHPTLSAEQVADLAVAALHDEIDLTPKPGLVDRRGSGAHSDMSATLLHDSADSLIGPLRECVYAGLDLAVGPELRARIGVIGRTGEAAMLTITRGVNTHRGALWALGLLSTAIGTGATGVAAILATAASLARLTDTATPSPSATDSHGARARRRYGVSGALGQAQSGFPIVTEHGLPALRTGGPAHALLALMANLDDTCVLHRGGMTGLADLQSGARAVLEAGGPASAQGERHFAALDRLCATRRLSPGGSGDLLAVTLFLDGLDGWSTACKP
jgi:triphosphoribosyl-dephospho-CoA synthase